MVAPRVTGVTGKSDRCHGLPPREDEILYTRDAKEPTMRHSVKVSAEKLNGQTTRLIGELAPGSILRPEGALGVPA